MSRGIFYTNTVLESSNIFPNKTLIFPVIEKLLLTQESDFSNNNISKYICDMICALNATKRPYYSNLFFDLGTTFNRTVVFSSKNNRMLEYDVCNLDFTSTLFRKKHLHTSNRKDFLVIFPLVWMIIRLLGNWQKYHSKPYQSSFGKCINRVYINKNISRKVNHRQKFLTLFPKSFSFILFFIFKLNSNDEIKVKSLSKDNFL